MNITTEQFLGYTLLPRIIPMVRDLLKPGFGLIGLSMAQIFSACGLLPRNHPYLNAQNMGRYGVSDVIVESARNLKFDRTHIDQVVIFSLLMGGMALLAAQFFILGFVMFTQVAHAQLYTDYFVTAQPQQDLAYILMDRVFGIPNLFGSCASTGVRCLTNDPNVPADVFPQPYHAALHDMLAFYSIGLCVVGLFILLYYAVAVVLETAESGTPFGRRFNHVWVPIRLVVALALLIPLTHGLNGAQLLTLHVAKWGSSFATNGWAEFVSVATDNQNNLAGPDSEMVGTPQKPDGTQMFRFFTVVAACKKMYEGRLGIDIDAYLVRSIGATRWAGLLMTDYAAARTFYDGGDISVVFGEQNDGKYPNEKGGVMPFCGEVSLAQVDPTDASAVGIQRDYYNGILRRYWQNAATGTPDIALAPQLANGRNQDFFYNAADRALEATYYQMNTAGPMQQDADGRMPNETARNALLTQWTQDVQQNIDNAIAVHASTNWTGNMTQGGWGRAAEFFNTIAQMNGGLMGAVANVPTVRRWPIVMEEVAKASSAVNKDRTADKKFYPYGFNNTPLTLPSSVPGVTMEFAIPLANIYDLWGGLSAREANITAAGTPSVVPPHVTQNALTDFLQGLFGSTGLYSMTQNTNIHPLAQIVIMGKYLVDASLRNLAIGMGFTVLDKTLSGTFKEIAQIIAGMLIPIGMMTLSVGFVLFYVVPFLPFLYFFFQVGGWIKALFEAMVGLPLWALAHIRIDGEGLPGHQAMQGYFLILEIFLRPILTIFGLVGSIAIFAAEVKVLNEIFGLVVSNVTGFDQANAAQVAGAVGGWYGYARGYVDQLFYTVIYAIIIYMLGTASFKLIYMVPDKTLRWMGANVKSFGDEIAQATPENLVGRMYGGLSAAGSQFGDALGKFRAG